MMRIPGAKAKEKEKENEKGIEDFLLIIVTEKKNSQLIPNTQTTYSGRSKNPKQENLKE